MIFCGLLGVASAGVGFAAGSAMFKSVWRVWNKEMAQNLQEVQKHKEHVKLPSNSSSPSFLNYHSTFTAKFRQRGRLDGYVIIICSLLEV